MSTSVTWPGGTTGATATAYAIPAAGELNWSVLSAFLIALGQGAQSTTFQLMAIRKATSSPVTIAAATDCIVGSKLSVAGAVTMNLPAGVNKQVFVLFDDTGDAGTNNITINRNGSDTIAGGTSLVLSHDREFVILCYNSGDTDWKIVTRSAPFASLKGSDLPLVTQSAAGVVSSAGQLLGTNTNDSASAGYVGELAIQSRDSGSQVSIASSGTDYNITASPLSLTAGQWEISGCVAFETNVSTSATYFIAAISQTSATIPSANSVPNSSGEIYIRRSQAASVEGAADNSIVIPPISVKLASTTNFYLVGEAGFTVSTMTAFGYIRAVRIR